MTDRTAATEVNNENLIFAVLRNQDEALRGLYAQLGEAMMRLARAQEMMARTLASLEKKYQ